MRCFWCDEEKEMLTADHIVPRSIGGTLEFTVPACQTCQFILSKAEFEVSRKSSLAIAALTAPLPPRHKKRPRSGHLQPAYLLVPHPYGGYGESLMSAGEKMSSLPYIEIKVVPEQPIEGRIRGAGPSDVQELLDTFRGLLNSKSGPGELVCELSVDMELGPEIAADPEFWPRMIMLPGNRLMIRARDPEEAMRFLNAFMHIAVSEFKVDSGTWGEGTVIKGGTQHLIALNYDPQCVRRVAAKIGYGIFRALSGEALERDLDEEMRQYILGNFNSEDETVKEGPERGTFTTTGDPHRVVISSGADGTKAIVCLYGFHFRVDLGPERPDITPFGVVCEIDGSGMRGASVEEMALVFNEIADIQFTHPWKNR
jgi:HNH endonuclease